MITEKFQLGVEAQFARMLFVVVVLFYVSWTTTVVSYSTERGRERERKRGERGEKERGRGRERESERERERGVGVGVQYTVGGMYRTRCKSLFQFCLLFVPAAVYNTFIAIHHTAPSGHGTIY